MSLFSLANLSVSILCISLAIAILPQTKNYAHRIWTIFNVIVAFWGLGLYFVGVAKTPDLAILSWKWTFVPNTFIPILFYHLIHAYCGLKNKKFLVSVYIIGSIFIPAIPVNYFVSEPILLFNSIYYFKPTTIFILWSLFFVSVTAISFVRLFAFIGKLQEAAQKREALYLFWGGILGFAGGTMTTILPLFKVMIYPVWHFSVSIYAALVTFAILRHKIFDLQVTLIRSLVPVFIFVVALFIFCFTHFKMNLFALASLSLGVACLLLAYLILAYAQQKMHRIWAIFNLCLAIWGLGTFVVGVSDNYSNAWIAWKIAYVGVLLVSVFFYHMIYIFCGLTNRNMLYFAYLQGIAVVFLAVATNLFIDKLEYLFNSFYYNKATSIYFIVFVLWMIIVVSAFGELFKFMRASKGIKRTQAQYLFWGMLLGFAGGTTVVAPAFGIKLYPYGHFFICIYAGICTYAIFKYQLMDIRIAVTRIGIFILVYSLILGLPFGLTFWGKDILVNSFGQYWYWIPIILTTIFATTGPFVYLYLQRKAEDQLLQEEQRTQALLEQASYGMNTLHTLEKLLKLITEVVIKTLRVDTTRIYLLNREADQYVLKAPMIENESAFNKEDAFIQSLIKKQYPLVYDEIKILSDMEDRDVALSDVEAQMKNLSANIIVPITLNNSLLGFLTLGERKSKTAYSKGLLNTLSILGNQCALAIDRCNVLEAETKRLEAEGLKERMVSLDHMASSMAHEIDNPMHIIRTSLSFVKSALLRDPRVSMPEEIKQDFDESLVRSLNASERVSSMIKAILDYSRMGTGKLESIRISDALEGFLQLIQPQIREEKVQFTKEIENDLPPVLGDRVQVEEVFMNFVRNSLHAVRRNEEKKISLKIFRKNETIIRIECTDNGYGIPREIINDIFLSSMTTKGSSEGTGLGLYRVRKIVDLFRGKVWAESEGKGKGATFIVELPVYEGPKSNGNEKS